MKKHIFIFILIFASLFLYGHPKPTQLPMVISHETVRADSAHGFDIQHYDLSIDIYDANNYIEGTVIATVLAEEQLTEIQYELESLNVDEVLVNGNPASYTHTAGVITIDLGTISPNEEFITTVSYSGNPVWIGLGMYFSSNYVFTISDPNASRYWWPCYDHPWDKALVDLTITCRDDWDAACNGLRTSIVNNGNGTKTYYWEG
jgi:aminopeptidase N